MAQQGLASQRVQDFGQVGVHPFAHARCKDHDIHGYVYRMVSGVLIAG
jgi:hypothetical protein